MRPEPAISGGVVEPVETEFALTLRTPEELLAYIREFG